MTERLATTIPVSSSTAPELGRVVEVRRRQWIGALVVPADLPKQNLARLASINEDAPGVEIEVCVSLSPMFISLSTRVPGHA